jgi:F0F1-type ATP synthase membrane subunit c/vacuolar-type H+-ATPase subunit K
MKAPFLRLLVVAAVLLLVAAPAFAQTAPTPEQQVEISKAANARTGPGLGIGLSVIGIGIGLGLIGYSALGSVARQPEQTGTIRGLMILLAALVEGAGIVGILFSLASMFL